MVSGTSSTRTSFVILAFTIICTSGLAGKNEIRYYESKLEFEDLESSISVPRDDMVLSNKRDDWSLRHLRLLRSSTNWGKLRGWWWSGFDNELEIPNQNRPASTPLELPSDFKVGERYVARCVYHRNGYNFQFNDGFRRVGPDDLDRRSNSSHANVSCGSRGALAASEVSALEDLHRALARERNLIRISREQAIEHAAANKASSNYTQPNISRYLSIVGSVSGSCLDKGLTHKLNNLELEVQLSWYLNRTFAILPLREAPNHSGCQKVIDLPWSYIIDFSGFPVVEQEVMKLEVKDAKTQAPRKSELTELTMPLTWKPEDLTAMRRISADPSVISLCADPTGYHAGPNGNLQKDYSWCTHYSRGMTWDAYFLPWSPSVRDAASSIAHAIARRAKRHGIGKSNNGSALNGNRNDVNVKERSRSRETHHNESHSSSNTSMLAVASSMDGVHFRSGDKTDAGDPYVGLPFMKSNELFCRISAHFAMHMHTSSDIKLRTTPPHDAAINNSSNPNGSSAEHTSRHVESSSSAEILHTSIRAQARPFYVATDSPGVLRRGRGAVALRHVWPHLYTAEDFTGLLARHCTEPQLYDPTRNCAHLTPFFTLAVEMALLEGVGHFVSTERSSPSRRIALKRYAARYQGSNHSAASRSSDHSTHHKFRHKSSQNHSSSHRSSGSVHYLYSSQVLHLTSETTNVAEWERATLRGDEAAVLVRDAAASDATVQRYETCAAQFPESSRCMRAHGFALASSMTSLSSAAAATTAAAAATRNIVASGTSNNEFMTTALVCCQLCQETHGNEQEQAVVGGICTAFQWETNHTFHGFKHQSSSSHSQSLNRSSEQEEVLVFGRCTLRSGEIEIMPASTTHLL